MSEIHFNICDFQALQDFLFFISLILIVIVLNNYYSNQDFHQKIEHGLELSKQDNENELI